jgi:hypothetical protein
MVLTGDDSRGFDRFLLLLFLVHFIVLGAHTDHKTTQFARSSEYAVLDRRLRIVPIGHHARRGYQGITRLVVATHVTSISVDQV